MWAQDLASCPQELLKHKLLGFGNWQRPSEHVYLKHSTMVFNSCFLLTLRFATGRVFRLSSLPCYLNCF